MPSNLPSSFASAAAGQNAGRDARGGRGDGRGGGGEWTRRDGRTNGTLTFRRSSTTPSHASQHAPPSDSAFPQTPAESLVQTPGVASYDFAPPNPQYGKHTILELFQNAQHLEVADVREPSWTPGHVNGNSSRGWGKSSHTHANQDPSSCWVSDGSSAPNSIRSFSAEEKEAFSSDVNSPLKPPSQKEGAQQAGTNGRKASVSHSGGPGFGLTSPTSASRPGTRRRETTDSNPFGSAGLSSPAGTGRFNRDDGGFILGRKGTEPKDQELSEEEGGGASTRDSAQGRAPFGGLVRSNTSGTGGNQAAGITPLWGQSNAAQQPTSAAGMGSFGQFALPTPTAIGGSVRGSRFANFIPRDNEGPVAKPAESTPSDINRSWRSRPRTDTDPFGDDGPSGSAALGGAQDSSPPPMPNPGTSDIGPFETPVKGSTGDFGMSGLNLGQHGDHEEGPISPSETNPYRSPPADRGDDHDDAGDKQHSAAFGGDQASNFGTMPRGFPTGHVFDGSDRSQTSSAGPKAYPPLSNLGGWPAPAPTGTPDRERQGFAGAFGNSLFSPVGDVQSPGLAGIGPGVFGPPSAGGIGGTGSLGRSKLGSLFPPAMQAQMQGHEHPENLSDSLPDLRQANPLGAIGRNAFGPARDSGSPMRSGRGGMFEDLFPSSAESRAQNQNVFGSIGGDPGMAGTPGAPPQSFTPSAGAAPAADVPTSQVRQMVMPDRMRWVYLDPQGLVQGPFTGLEMNDWYKANFFTADLRVKKVEDPDFEPLGQLIRRIGNSREPFLVPQIGVPHGPPVQGGPFSPTTTGGIVPPLSGLFPSFGRTLTAEEQNNLERRKQEEQFAMAQQREHLIRQQAISRLHPGTGQSSLHHHSSAHSLQSQPSFGSIASPIGAPQQTPTAGPMGAGSAFFDGASGQQGSGQPPIGASFDSFRDDDLATLNATERQMLAGSLQGSGGSFFPPQPIGAPGDALLRGNLPGTEQLAEDEEGFRERLKEFEGLRAEHEAQQQHGDILQQSIEDEQSMVNPASIAHHGDDEFKSLAAEVQKLSLTQQVQAAQAAAAAQSAVTGLPTSFPPPPPQSGTPLPAPTAQRARSNLPEQYSRSQSGTPDTSSAVEPPPLAPWAKETGPGGRKGPSLKEIQETEARNAAKAEEAAAAARRAALEQEAAALREREKAAAASIATGLPTTSTWGNGSPVPAGSPWTKPGATKAPAAVSGPSKQKTLADIQREEEARKAKAHAQAQALAAQAGVAPVPNNKRYADFAVRPGNAALGPQPAGTIAPPPGSGWATVGAGGKVKVPTGPAAQSPVRSVSAASNVKTAPAPKPIVKPAPSSTATTAKSEAMDEFKKWLDRELARGITGVDLESFATTLLVLPLEPMVIEDAIYANSKTMNGQHFAEEFIKRKKRADLGIVEKQPGSTATEGGAAGSGWNEVAKKGGNKEAPAADNAIQGAGFKVVPGRKKGGKK